MMASLDIENYQLSRIPREDEEEEDVAPIPPPKNTAPKKKGWLW
jgi:hypothetical protein